MPTFFVNLHFFSNKLNIILELASSKNKFQKIFERPNESYAIGHLSLNTMLKGRDYVQASQFKTCSWGVRMNTTTIIFLALMDTSLIVCTDQVKNFFALLAHLDIGLPLHASSLYLVCFLLCLEKDTTEKRMWL